MKTIARLAIFVGFCTLSPKNFAESPNEVNSKIKDFIECLEQGDIDFVIMAPFVSSGDPFAKGGPTWSSIGYGEIPKTEIKTFALMLKAGLMPLNFGDPGVTFRLIPISTKKPYNPQLVVVCRLTENDRAVLIINDGGKEFRLQMSEQTNKFLRARWRNQPQ